MQINFLHHTLVFIADSRFFPIIYRFINHQFPPCPSPYPHRNSHRCPYSIFTFFSLLYLPQNKKNLLSQPHCYSKISFYKSSLNRNSSSGSSMIGGKSSTLIKPGISLRSFTKDKISSSSSLRLRSSRFARSSSAFSFTI